MRSGGLTETVEILLPEARRLQGETTALRVRQKGEILSDIKGGEIAEQPGQRFGRLTDENDAGVDGETADYNVDGGWWQVFIGEESATIGADGIAITDGGVYKLVYTIG